MSLWFVKKLTRNTIAGFTFFLPDCHFGFTHNVWNEQVLSLMSTLYERLGGEDTIRRLVTRFYDLMAHDPRAMPPFRPMAPASIMPG